MKKITSIFFALFLLSSVSVFAQSKTESFKVYGNCGMCKKRIEKAVHVEGVSKADWNTETKIITVTYDSSKISNKDLQQKIAAVGHDTEKYAANDKVYEKLPGCCLYDRKKSAQKED